MDNPDLYLQDISAKCIEFFLAHIVVPDGGEYLYNSARESFINICWFNQRFAAVESER